jgi:opacity protein-like surface antigen
MKKLYVLALALCLMAGAANAQKMYIRAGLGGGVGLKQYANSIWADETQTTTTDNLTIKSTGLGGGFNVNAAFGYKFSDYIGLELGVNEFIGLTKKMNRTDPTSTMEVKMSGMMLQLVPAVLITPNLEKVNPYARLGMIVGVLPSITIKNSDNSTTGGTSTDVETKMKLSGGVALGFTAAGGVMFNLSDNLSLYGELVYNGITYAPSKGVYKTYTVNGTDRLGDMTTKEKEIDFVKKYDANEEIPDGSPSKEAKVSFQFSDVLLNVGVVIKL